MVMMGRSVAVRWGMAVRSITVGAMSVAMRSVMTVSMTVAMAMVTIHILVYMISNADTVAIVVRMTWLVTVSTVMIVPARMVVVGEGTTSKMLIMPIVRVLSNTETMTCVMRVSGRRVLVLLVRGAIGGIVKLIMAVWMMVSV